MGTAYQGTSEIIRALDVYIKFSRAYETLTAHLKQHLDTYGLTESQFGTLETIHHLGPMCQAEIGEKILKTSGNMTMVIDNLVKQNLVRRERDLKDRRHYQIHFTKQGKEIIEDIFPKHAEIIKEAFSILSTKEQEELGKLLKIIGTQTFD